MFWNVLQRRHHSEFEVALQVLCEQGLDRWSPAEVTAVADAVRLGCRWCANCSLPGQASGDPTAIAASGLRCFRRSPLNGSMLEGDERQIAAWTAGVHTPVNPRLSAKQMVVIELTRIRPLEWPDRAKLDAYGDRFSDPETAAAALRMVSEVLLVDVLFMQELQCAPPSEAEVLVVASPLRSLSLLGSETAAAGAVSGHGGGG